MFTYKDKDYGSKAEVVRELYDQGKVTLSVVDKKRVANELGMSVQTVHATIIKYIINIKPSGNKIIKTEKITPAIIQVNNKLNLKLSRVRSGRGPIFIRDKSEEVQVELMKDLNKIEIWYAPNQWAMPVTNPHMFVIDENYDPDWISPDLDDIPREEIEKNW